MEYISGVVSNVHSFASKINPATLSGKKKLLIPNRSWIAKTF